MQGRTARTRGVLVVLAAAVLLLLAPSPTPAFAHAGLVSSSPDDGARLASAPAQVALGFSTDLASPAYVVVTADDGTILHRGDPAVDGAVVTQRLAPGQAGGYTVAYRVVAADGHPITGRLGFEVTRGTGSTGAVEAATPAPDPAPTAANPSRAGQVEAVASGPGGPWDGYDTALLGGGLLLAAAGLLVARRRG